jgi:hypothetical protein
METVIGLVAAIVAILGLLGAVGYGGYLMMLQSVANKRPGASHLVADARKRLPAAGGLTLGALVALLLTSGGLTPDIIGLLLGGGIGLVSVNQLQAARKRLANPGSSV